jgi:hypothetical protein
MDPVAILRQAAAGEPIWRQLPDNSWRVVESDAELTECRVGDLRIGNAPKIWFARPELLDGSGGFGWHPPAGPRPRFYRLAEQIKADGTQDLSDAELVRRYSQQFGRNGRLNPRTVKKAKACIN